MEARSSLTAGVPRTCTAFAGSERIASGSPGDVAAACKALLDAGETRPVLIFDDATAHPVEMDFRGTPDEMERRLSEREVGMGGSPDGVPKEDEAARRTPGRPKLGVVGREVTLLPRHWQWLNAQPGGASVALRKLVEQARRANEGKDRVRRSREVAYRFMSAVAGNEPGYEEAVRSLFAGDRARFEANTATWPGSVRDYALQLGAEGLGADSPVSLPVPSSDPS